MTFSSLYAITQSETVISKPPRLFQNSKHCLEHKFNVTKETEVF